MTLIDIGANLTHSSYDADRDAVLARAAAQGVCQMIVTGSDAQESASAIALAHAHPCRLFATVGLHPHHAAHFDYVLSSQLTELAQDPAVVAIGECGLDYHRNFSPREAQLVAFRAQLELAVVSGKPVFLHLRDAQEDFMGVMREYASRISRGVAHCFTGQLQDMQQCLDLGLYIGITGWICDERRGAHLLEAVRYIPSDRLMIETDAPYLLPRTLRPRPASRRNEPGYLPEVLRVIAHARGESVEECAALTTANARRFFSLPDIKLQ
ncbi:MAG: TatD family hydrolase [Steroidobacteraceae bacterium]